MNKRSCDTAMSEVHLFFKEFLFFWLKTTCTAKRKHHQHTDIYPQSQLVWQSWLSGCHLPLAQRGHGGLGWIFALQPLPWQHGAEPEPKT